MAGKLTIKGATVRVAPEGGLKFTREDIAPANERLATLAAANNGKHLRCDAGECGACDACERRADRGAVLLLAKAMVRLALTGAIAPVSLPEARTLYGAGRLACTVAPFATVSTGASAASVNMALDRDARAFGGGDKFTLRAFAMPGDKRRIVVYVGYPKGGDA
jgi:hypothetical protein